MGKASVWGGSTFPLSTWLDDHDQGRDTALLIADKSTSITVLRGGVAQAAQTVRIEENRSQRQVVTNAGQVYQVDAIVIGYKGTPGVTDTDLKPGDRFAIAGTRYEVIMLVVGLTDGLQAYARVIA